MVSGYGSKAINSFSAGIDLRRHILTSEVGPRTDNTLPDQTHKTFWLLRSDAILGKQ